MEIKKSSAALVRAIIESSVDVNIYLINGVKLSGKLISADQDKLTLTKAGVGDVVYRDDMQVIYRNAISTIEPQSQIHSSFFTEESSDEDEGEDLIDVLIREKVPAKLYLKSGICLLGTIQYEFADMFLLKTTKELQAVMKQAIATVTSN
ncbi:RNA-binding protein Hfq [compost metagenome]